MRVNKWLFIIDGHRDVSVARDSGLKAFLFWPCVSIHELCDGCSCERFLIVVVWV